MDGELEQATGGKLRRRATVLMTGAALTALYVWMQPAALGTLEANSAQAADGTTTGCVLKVGSTPLTVGGQEVRVQSNELCNGVNPNLASMPRMPAAAPPADLRRSSIGEETKAPPQIQERFSRAAPRIKPELPSLASERADLSVAELTGERDEVERDHFRLAEREDRPDDPDDRPDDDRDDGGEHSGGGGESGGDEVCERDDSGGGYSGDGGERDDGDRDGGDRDGGEGGEGGEGGGGGSGSH